MSKDDIYKFFFKKFKKKLKRGVPNQGNSSIKTIIDLTSFSRILRNLTKNPRFRNTSALRKQFKSFKFLTTPRIICTLSQPVFRCGHFSDFCQQAKGKIPLFHH